MRTSAVRDRLRRSAWVAVLSIGALSCFVPGQVRAEPAAPIGPRIELQVEQIDLGSVKAGESAEGMIEFRNGGDTVLEIRQVQSS